MNIYNFKILFNNENLINVIVQRFIKRFIKYSQIDLYKLK